MNIRREGGERSRYAIARPVASGVYKRIADAATGASVRRNSRLLRVPRSFAAVAANATSRTSATTAPANVARASAPTWLVVRPRQNDAARPAAAPTIERLLVYASHLRCGGCNISPTSDAAPTTIAASGPNNTAAKRIGKTAIDW